jgi:hypothetical protein
VCSSDLGREEEGEKGTPTPRSFSNPQNTSIAHAQTESL